MRAARALAMNQLAGVLTDLDLVRWPLPKELEKLVEEETVTSDTDLTSIRKTWLDENKITGELAEQHREQQPIRNHGLFSKAERALELAGWSEGARRDVEIYVFEDTDGLTPLLTVLNTESDISDAPVLIEVDPPKPALLPGQE